MNHAQSEQSNILQNGTVIQALSHIQPDRFDQSDLWQVLHLQSD